MMRMNNISVKVTVDKGQLLAQLRANLTEHQQIVKEAIEGYNRDCVEQLRKRLEAFEQGKARSLYFPGDKRPDDKSECYKTVIGMLELGTDEAVELGPDEYRQLYENKWDWADDFYLANSSYSSTARQKIQK